VTKKQEERMELLIRLDELSIVLENIQDMNAVKLIEERKKELREKLKELSV